MLNSPLFSSSRRAFGKAVAGAALATPLAITPGRTQSQPTTAAPQVHRFTQADPILVNAYIVEGQAGLVVIDATLTNAASTALRAEVEALAKPLLAVLLTHPHPDHYAGIGNLVAGLDVPVVAVSGVNDIVRRDDAEKDTLVGGMFGNAWPQDRVFPNHIVADGERLTFEDLAFEVRDIGPAESFHDSLFILEGSAPHAFVGDLVYGLMHSYMADNTNPDWLRALARLKDELPEDIMLHVGHGGPVTPAMLDWQAGYIERFETALAQADWSNHEAAQAGIVARMRDYLPSDDLLVFLQLSVLPNAQRLGFI